MEQQIQTLRAKIVDSAMSFAQYAFNEALEPLGTYVKAVVDLEGEIIVKIEDTLSADQIAELMKSTIRVRKDFETHGFKLGFEYPSEQGNQVRVPKLKQEDALEVHKLRKVWHKGEDVTGAGGFDKPWVLSINGTGVDILKVYPDTHRLEFVNRTGRNPELTIPAKVYSDVEKPVQAMKDYANKVLSLVLGDKTQSCADIRRICNWAHS